MPTLLQGDVVVVCHAVIAMHDKPLFQQELGEVEADKAGRACDQDFLQSHYLCILSGG